MHAWPQEHSLYRRCAAAWRGAAALSLCIASATLGVARAADHTDAPRDDQHPRRDAQISDFYTFVKGSGPNARLVLILAVNPFIGPIKKDHAPFRWPSDVTYRFQIDNNSAVDLTPGPLKNAFGGSIVDPDGIDEDLTIQVSFDGANHPELKVLGGTSAQRKAIKNDILGGNHFFADYRADAFNFAPFYNRNTAAIVAEVKLDLVKSANPTNQALLLWATTSVEDFDEHDGFPANFGELGARALRSQSDEFKEFLNQTQPRKHVDAIEAAYGNTNPCPMGQNCGYAKVADVVILDLTSAAGFPNGRRLTDDVVAQLAAPSLAPYNDDRIFLAEAAICPTSGMGGANPPPFSPFDPDETVCKAFVSSVSSPLGSPNLYPGLVNASETQFPYLAPAHEEK